jgi:hypothetical protein
MSVALMNVAIRLPITTHILASHMCGTEEGEKDVNQGL